MAIFDFDFQRYVERRKGAREAEAREGAAYAYAGDLKVLRTLDKVRPVKLALEATVRLWRHSARAELLGTSIKVTEKHFPKVFALGARAAEALHIEPPGIFVSPQLATTAGLHAYTFGTDDDAAIVLHAGLVEALSPDQLLFVIGHQSGHLQNHHVVYRTALYFLLHSAGAFLRWIVAPAVMALEAWSRRGQITADRAGLVCVRDIDLAAAALLGSESPEMVVAPSSAGASEPTPHGAGGRPADGASAERRPDGVRADLPGGAGAAHPADVKEAGRAAGLARAELDRRVAALRVFADSAYYRGLRGESGGYPPEACDDRVAEILSKGA